MLAVAATLLPAWWYARDATAIVLVALLVATAAGVAAVAVVRRRPFVAAGLLVLTALAPTYFLYVGNLLCLALAVYLLVARRRLV